MFVTYDERQPTRSGRTAVYPKVKRVYIAGNVKDWKFGDVKKRTGRKVHGVQIEYEQSRAGFDRREYTAHRGRTTYEVKPANIGKTSQIFTKVVEVPKDAERVHFYKDADKLPAKYKSAIQDVK
jgi:hypothetical protein